ncbi:hypothetical protein B0T24DRAFT_699721 [Lasiosphaeria ovina]|uniref:Uncharacterized protein n=1 Tax=Lasiosphaeria ovina TaxID=92902 RepID=A0AAE0KGF2_9PEZI|nr:hypothetical protein B0T24DRAFT_699721 [Lasiosphaeria ovina]
MRIEWTISGPGKLYPGWGCNGTTADPLAAAAKQPLLRLVPHMPPAGGNEAGLYRFELDHSPGYFDTGNVSIAINCVGEACITPVQGSMTPMGNLTADDDGALGVANTCCSDDA